jgi:rhodanese-related sulfurtransferase
VVCEKSAVSNRRTKKFCEIAVVPVSSSLLLNDERLCAAQQSDEWRDISQAFLGHGKSLPVRTRQRRSIIMTIANATSSDTFATITPRELRERLKSYDELAVIDVRDGGLHSSEGHILRSASLPLSHLELRAVALIPRLATDIVVYDGGSGELAERAARRLRELGYGNVTLLAGGAQAWKEAGYELFTGSNVIGKAFGEFAEHVYGTPHISVQDAKKRIDAGENIVVLDSRPEREFLNFSIPGAIDLPGAELVYRFHAAVPDPDTLVVINCAGRTRSIIGAQALINAGVPNRVVSLANGTMDWLIEGYELQSGKSNLARLPNGAALEAAKASAERLTKRFELQFIDRAALAGFQHEAAEGRRSLYLLDVRGQAEYEAGHYPGSRWAAGGQLVQQVGEWVATQNSRIVLIDSPDHVRASITASWLAQINWADVFILKDALTGAVELGPEPSRPAIHPPQVDTIDVDALLLLDPGGATVLDLDTSVAHKAGHIPGSRFAIRSRLADSLASIGGNGPLVLTSTDGVLAAFAAAEIAGRTDRSVRVLVGGTAAWRAVGLPLVTEITEPVHPFEDLWLTPYHAKDRFAAFREYLDWEIGLVAQLERDGTSRFRVFPADRAATAQAAE